MDSVTQNIIASILTSAAVATLFRLLMNSILSGLEYKIKSLQEKIAFMERERSEYLGKEDYHLQRIEDIKQLEKVESRVEKKVDELHKKFDEIMKEIRSALK